MKPQAKPLPFRYVVPILVSLMLFGHCSTSKADMYVESTPAEAFVEHVIAIAEVFKIEYENNPTDMGIVMAQINLKKRIDHALSIYEMNTNAERLQAEKEDRQLDRQGIWKEMTNNH